MIAHYLKLLWKRRSSNLFLFLELVVTFFILIMVFQYTLTKSKFYNQPLGFKVENQVLVTLTPENLHEDSLQFFQTIANIKHGLQQLPSVEAVALENEVIPYGNSQWSTGNDVENGFEFNTEYCYVDEEGANAWEIPITRGRFFTKEDFALNTTPIVVNEEFVKKWMKGKDPVGFEFEFGRENVKIVGVAQAFKYRGDFEESTPFAFLPSYKKWDNANNLILKIKGSSMAEIQPKIQEIVQRELHSDDFVIQPMSEIKRSYNNHYWVPIIGMISITIFLIINIALGLFGSLRYAVHKRRSEIGLRKVVGASTGNIRFQIVGEVLLIMGIALLVALIPALQIIKFGNFEIDTSLVWKSILGSFVLITLLLVICSLFPSQKIAKLPPAVALHED